MVSQWCWFGLLSPYSPHNWRTSHVRSSDHMLHMWNTSNPHVEVGIYRFSNRWLYTKGLPIPPFVPVFFPIVPEDGPNPHVPHVEHMRSTSKTHTDVGLKPGPKILVEVLGVFLFRENRIIRSIPTWFDPSTCSTSGTHVGHMYFTCVDAPRRNSPFPKLTSNEIFPLWIGFN